MMTIHNLSLLIRTWNAQINDEITNLPHMDTVNRENELQKDIYGDISDYYDSTAQENYNTKFNFDFENHLAYIVENGLTEEFKKMNQKREDYRSRQSFISSNALRQYKDQCISMTTVISRAAMRGGLNLDIAYRLFDLYCQKIELANNMNDLISIQTVMLIDYTKRVEDLHTRKTSDPLISKALSYINRHLTMKLTATMIAKKIGINPNYLSIRFKAAMGQSIPKYINY